MSDPVAARSLDSDRVVVVGTSGSGKTSLARRLARELQVPHIELDALFWGPNWTPQPVEHFRERVAEAVAGERWVLDGNYAAVRDLAWRRATLIVWLDFSFGRVFGRVLWRTLRRVFRREELFSGNRESLAQSFLSRDSILWWMITSYHRRKREYGELLRPPAERSQIVVECRAPEEVEALVERVVGGS